MDDIIRNIIAFRDERDWKQFHNSKDLAISLSLEASELLELFQWSTADAVRDAKREELQDELADVLIYALTLAHDLDINVETAIRNKMKKNAAKYPVDKSLGTSKKYTDLEK
ncbi:nucleotide pyrophosphohydrolase [Paenibacillus sp.]|uniref:nucleotide pyrophosphohydrolase n=1 Tax=Paenibacillus sp. TaxID=58172 RepID=UPI002810DF95|nr:nucleotide pyrophosphohydrolase [Paenibacillus sp.]